MYRHSADSCNRKITCAFCKQNHFSSECPKKKGGIEEPKFLQCDKNLVSCTKECKFYKKAKEVENLRQDGKTIFDETKIHYSQLNSGNLPIKINGNENDETNLKVGYPKQKSRRAILNNNNKLTLNMDDNDSVFTYDGISICNSFSDLSVEELSESENEDMWWDSNLRL